MNKSRFLFLALAAGMVPTTFAAAQAGGPPVVVVKLRSPEILPDHTVTFRFSAPSANEVTLNGSFPGGRNIKMTKDEDGVWSPPRGEAVASGSEVEAWM